MARASYCSNHNQVEKNPRRLHYLNILLLSLTRKVLEEENKYITKSRCCSQKISWFGSTEAPGTVGSSHGNLSTDNYGAATIILNMPGEKGVAF